MKNGSGTYYYRERRKRYDGVWVDDVAKCGVFGDLDPQAFSTEPFPIPKVSALERLPPSRPPAHAHYEAHARLRPTWFALCSWSCSSHFKCWKVLRETCT